MCRLLIDEKEEDIRCCWYHYSNNPIKYGPICIFSFFLSYDSCKKYINLLNRLNVEKLPEGIPTQYTQKVILHLIDCIISDKRRNEGGIETNWVLNNILEVHLLENSYYIRGQCTKYIK